MEPIHRRIRIPDFPGPIIVDGREEFYVESIYQEVKYSDNRPDRAYIVIWAGWPTSYATIEPVENFWNCVALDLFEAANNGCLVGTGTHKNVRCTAVRSSRINRSSAVPYLHREKWPVDWLDDIFEKRIIQGIYKKSIGFFDHHRDRMRVFDMEVTLWKEVHQIFKPASNIFISPTFYGNYFGSAKRYTAIKKIESKKLETSWNVITKTISGQLNAMSSDKEKFCILLFVSQVGNFNADMNDPSAKGEPYKTHSCVLVARERKISNEQKTERDYFWFEPTYHLPKTPYKPMKFLLKGNFGHKNKINVMYGDQVDSHDCFYRCLRWISDVTNGKVVFEGIHKQYDFNKRLEMQ